MIYLDQFIIYERVVPTVILLLWKNTENWFYEKGFTRIAWTFISDRSANRHFLYHLIVESFRLPIKVGYGHKIM